jgi:hypothetical protein
MEFMEWLCLLAMVVVMGFFFVFLFWRAFARQPRGAMSRGRIVWLLLGGLSVILTGCFVALGAWLYGPPPRVMTSNVEAFTTGAMSLAWFGWGIAEISIALRAAFARTRA